MTRAELFRRFPRPWRWLSADGGADIYDTAGKLVMGFVSPITPHKDHLVIEGALAALIVDLVNAAEDQPQWRHKVRGSIETEICRASLQKSSPNPLEEGAVIVSYRGDDGKLWAREESEFEDGRFEPVVNAAEGS